MVEKECLGTDVNCIVYGEDSTDSITIYWNNGVKTKCLIMEELKWK